MFSYYGSKSKVIEFYPKPRFQLIIEPFAGSARYALRYFEREVILVDKYDIIVRVWNYLKQCSPNDILSLPDLEVGSKIIREDFDCIEQAWLMGFMINTGVSFPMLTMSKWGKESFVRNRKFIASSLFKIKHWTILNDDYTNILNTEATWFIDPPYQQGGYKYKHSKVDYIALRDWSLSRLGQIVVCENTNSKWMDFKPMKEQNGCTKRTTEAFYTNMPSSYNSNQQKLIL